MVAWLPIEAEEPEISLHVTVEAATARVGEPITMTIRATHPQGIEWEARSVSDRLGPFDIRQVKGPELLPPVGGEPSGSGQVVTAWTFRLTAFELGDLEIPPLTLRYAVTGSAEPRSVSTEAGTVTVEATVKGAEEEPADVRSGFLPPAVRRIGVWLAGLGLLLAAAGALWLWRRRRRKPKVLPLPAPRKPRAPQRPAYDRWLEALERLLAERLVEAGRTRDFHIRLAEIVKSYLGEVFAFDAIDRTSQEVLWDLESRARPTLRAEMGALLGQCDLVKFAEHAPRAEESLEAARRARTILDLGRPAAPAQAQGPPAAQRRSS